MTTKRSMIVAGVLALATRAHADDHATHATQHIERASALHKAGQLVDALAELEAAYGLDPRPQLLFAMGQIHVQLGQCPQAITYYEQFLATRPSAEVAAVTGEAIETCKTNPPPAVALPAPEPVAPPTVKSAPLSAPVPLRERTPWYSDHVGDAIVVGGVISGVVGLVLWRSAVSDRDEADATDNYERFGSLVDSAHRNQTTAIVFGIASAVLVTAGGVHIALHHRPTDLAIAPTPSGGGAITWMGRF